MAHDNFLNKTFYGKLNPEGSTLFPLILETGGRPVFQTHTQRQTLGRQYALDFSQRLLAQVGGLQKLNLGALNQITDVIDLLGLQAVGGTYRQLQIVHRAQQDRVHIGLFGNGAGLLPALQINEAGQLVLQDRRRGTNGLFRIQRTVRFQFDDELVEIGALFKAGILNRVGNARLAG